MNGPLCTVGGAEMYDEVLLYNYEENRWTTVGHMSTRRRYHAISLVPMETADYCVWYFYNNNALCELKYFQFGYVSKLCNTLLIGNDSDSKNGWL